MMRVLVTGAGGFIGSALVGALLARGHHVVACEHRRRAQSPHERLTSLAVDYMQDLDASAWLPRLKDVDAVVNAVGILRENAHASFEALHHQAPVALFNACVQAGVSRCIQISALGADDGATSAYHRTKCAADSALRRSGLAWTIVQPSLVFGPRGASTQLFITLASLPVSLLVGRGDQQVQPVHIDDLSALIVHLLDESEAVDKTIAAVGPRALSQKALLRVLRKGMTLPDTLEIPVPLWAIRLAAWLGDVTNRGALSSETLGMLLRGNTASATSIRRVLGHPPRDPSTFIPHEQALDWRLTAVMSWLSPMLLLTLAVMWISAGVVSWIYAQRDGIHLLTSLGLSPTLAQPAFAAACLVDITFGILCLTAPGRGLWLTQLAVTTFYTAALTLVASDLWIDPFGPLVKNLPIAGMLLGLAAVHEGK